MSIELTTFEPATNYTLIQGGQIFPMISGKTLRIETSPAGVEYLNVECPSGKAWDVSLYVVIKETNV